MQRGLDPVRLCRAMRTAVEDCRLDLTGRTVLTEAATGAYVSTAVLAAMAGAQVTALTRTTRFGSAEDVRAWTTQVAHEAAVSDRIHVVESLTSDELAAADVVTNSGHLRPLDADLVSRLKPGAVVPLMMEAWEIGAGRADVDLAALRRRGIAFAGTNERNPAVGVFDYLGVMAVKLLVDAGVPVHATDVTLLCDNDFADYIAHTLDACGARVTRVRSPEELADCRPMDALVVALTPADGPRVTEEPLRLLSERSPGTVVAQFFGEVDRRAAESYGFTCWPSDAPPHGHMGILPHEIGPEPVIRLQVGGLKVGQVLLTPTAERTPEDLAFLDVL